MIQPSSPFSKLQLLPQEEKLEVLKQKGELFIGIPRESQFQERRICLTPDGVNALTANGHKVLIEAGAGEDASFTDLEYPDMKLQCRGLFWERKPKDLLVFCRIYPRNSKKKDC